MGSPRSGGQFFQLSRLLELLSPECIHTSSVHDEAFTMCFIRELKRKRLNLLTDSKEKKLKEVSVVVVVVISASCVGCKVVFSR